MEDEVEYIYYSRMIKSKYSYVAILVVNDQIMNQIYSFSRSEDVLHSTVVCETQMQMGFSESLLCD